MPTEIKLPSLGDGIESADVLEVFVSEGETVTKEQGLVELETDKATVTVPSPFAGKLVKLSMKEGETLKVGQVIAIIETADTAAEAPKAAAPAPEAKPEPPPAPEPAKVAPPAAKSTPEPAPAAAKPAEPAAKAAPAAATSTVATQPAPKPSAPVSETDESIAAGPAIRRFAREVGVDLAKVTGTGEYGRITRDDVLNVVKRLGQQSAQSTATEEPAARPSTSTATGAASSSKPTKELPGTKADDDFGPIRVAKMEKIRKVIATQMHKSWSTVPRVVNFDDADITDLETFRQNSKDDYAKRGIKLTTMPFLIKAVATALKNHPAINANVDMENEQIIYKDYVSIGIAVDAPQGLVVPTLKNADRMSIPDVASRLVELSTMVRDKTYSVADLRGGTFTISNLGAIGGTYSTPIVNVPEVAILLVGRSRKLPVVMDDDRIVPRLMMPLSLAYDHRLVDGATAARFLNDVIALLEAPSRLLLAI